MFSRHSSSVTFAATTRFYTACPRSCTDLVRFLDASFHKQINLTKNTDQQYYREYRTTLACFTYQVDDWSNTHSGFQARSRGGRWSWTLTLTQKRPRAGRWSWAAKVGLLSLRVVPQHCPSDSAQHGSWNRNCAVHKSLRNGEGTPPLHFYCSGGGPRSLRSFSGGIRGRAFTLSSPPPPPPPPPATSLLWT